MVWQEQPALSLVPRPTMRHQQSSLRNRKSRAVLDVIVIGAISLVVFVVASWLDVFELVVAWVRQHNSWQGDEMVVVLVVLAFAFGVFSFRRWNELQLEMRDRIAAERDARESERTYRELFEAANDAIIIFEPEREIVLDMNDRACTLYDVPRDRLVGSSFEVFSGNTARGKQYIQEIVNGRESVRFESVHRTVDGREFVVEVTGGLVHFEGAEAIVSINRDVTERRDREDRLIRQNRALLELTAADASLFGDIAAAARAITRLAAETLGVERASVWLYTEDRAAIVATDLYERGRDLHSTGHRLTAEAFPGYMAALEREPVLAADDARRDPRTIEFTESYLVPNGITSMLDAPIRAGGKVVGVLCHEHVGPARAWSLDEQNFAHAMAAMVSLVLYVHELARAEEQVHEVTDRLNLALESAQAGTWSANLVDGTTHWDADLCHLFGRAPSETCDALENLLLCVHPDDRERVRNECLQWRDTAGELEHEFRVMLPDGSIRHIASRGKLYRDVRGQAARIAGVSWDVTRSKESEAALERSEEQLRHAQRLESVGRLAGGVAHDFNNLLTVIGGYTQLAYARLEHDHPVTEMLNMVSDATERAAALTRQLLAFSRKQTLKPEVVDLNEAVAKIESILQRLIGEDITIETRLDPHLGAVLADPGQIEQVLLNLAVNARDAMPDGGLLRIETANTSLDRAPQDPASAPLEGRGVVLSVSDTGCGMDAGTKAQIFEPFFTTKEQGKGTGLGLATVYGIVMQSGGAIDVDSTPGAGTTFRLYFPRIAEPMRADSQTTDERSVSRGHECVLVVEDDAAVRGLARETLRAHGYSVVEAGNPEQALCILADRDDPIDLVLSDVVMPGMSGFELADGLRSTYAGLRVLLMSGYSTDAIASGGNLNTSVRRIDKPFRPGELLRCVREVLDDV